MDRNVRVFFWLLLPVLWSCENQTNKLPVTNVAEQMATLHQVLNQSEKWVKVHAAEYLLELGDTTSVQKVFEQERQKFETEAQYRIGIWRVLARQAASPQERQLWIARIETAYRDTAGPDRPHAAETLAKLRVNLNQLAPEQVQADLQSRDLFFRSFVVWGTAVNTDLQPLMDLLKNGKEIERLLAAYALGRQPKLNREQWLQLYNIAISEPVDSRAYVDLICSAYLHCPRHCPVRKTTTERIAANLAGAFRQIQPRPCFRSPGR